jgi:hypothetical protein
MIRDVTIDQTLIELARTMKALKALRAARREAKNAGTFGCWSDGTPRESGAVKRASMDLTRKLADLRQGR